MASKSSSSIEKSQCRNIRNFRCSQLVKYKFPMVKMTLSVNKRHKGKIRRKKKARLLKRKIMLIRKLMMRRRKRNNTMMKRKSLQEKIVR